MRELGREEHWGPRGAREGPGGQGAQDQADCSPWQPQVPPLEDGAPQEQEG